MKPRLRARAAAFLLAFGVAVTAVPMAVPGRAAAAGLAPLTSGQLAHRLSGDVFGYLPYWSLRSWTDAYLRYDLLSTIAFFGVGVRDDGTLVTSSAGYRAYMSDTATQIIEHAHAAGVRTVITFESFGYTHNATFFSDPVARATFVTQATALMAARGADGANLDVELISGTYFPGYGALVKALGEAARAANPIAEISVATNGNTSGARMAAIAVAKGADRAFLMGYAYRSGGSSPTGSIDPLVRFDDGLSLSASLDLYAAYGVPSDRILLGLPFYGMTWPTVSDALHAARQPTSAGLGAGKAFFPYTLSSGAPAGSVLDHDPIEQSARLTWFDAAANSWYQTYYDDPESLAPKARLAIDRDLAGMGIWALGYERGQPGYWETIAATFQGPRIASFSLSPNPTRSRKVTVAVGWTDGAHPTTSMRFSNDGRTWSAWQPLAATATWYLPAVDGTRTVWAELADAVGAVSPARTAKTLLDTHGPTMTSLSMTYQSAYGRWKIRYGASDALTGVQAYQVRYRIGYGSWHILKSSTTSTVAYLKLAWRYRLTVAVRARDGAGNWGPYRYLIHRP